MLKISKIILNYKIQKFLKSKTKREKDFWWEEIFRKEKSKSG